jgi:hypothetical protein
MMRYMGATYFLGRYLDFQFIASRFMSFKPFLR